MTLRRASWITVTLGLTTGLIGCRSLSDSTDADGTEGYSLAGTNGLANINGLALSNGLAGTNGLANTNGLALSNGLANTNGLAATNGLMTTSGGRDVVKYLARCALTATDSLVKQDQNGASYTFPGGLGLCPSWKTSGIYNSSTCQNYVSACMLAHVNTAGVHIPIWIVGQASSVGWGQNPTYPNQEGTFFGNIMHTNTVGHVDAYYCNGPGFDKDVVPGRLGANQSGAPYRNTFASLYCNYNGCVPSDSKTGNTPDGYKACTMGDGATNTWNEMLTVWRQNKAYDGNGNAIAGQTANGATIRYDFETGSDGWSGSGLSTANSTEVTAQAGSKSLKISNTGAGTFQLKSQTGRNIAAGQTVTIYYYIPSNTPIYSVNPMIHATGGQDTKVSKSVSWTLQGSWNFVTIQVPSGQTADWVGIEIQTNGASFMYTDAITY